MSRIAFVSTLGDVPWGGSEALWFQAALNLRTRGHEVLANVQWWPQTPTPVNELKQAGVLVQARRTTVLQRLRSRISSPPAEPETSWLEKAAPELVVISLHCHGNGLEWMQACRNRQVPYVVVVHAFVDHWWPTETRKLAQAYNAATALFFVSHANHRQASIQLAHALPAARVVRNPFNVNYEAAPAWPADSSTLKLACVGRLDPGNKGQDILLQVLALDKWMARPVRLTLFGDGPQRESIFALRDFLGLEGRVESGGFTSDVEQIWRSHHALALTSRAEGLPIVIVEAMLCGRPCLVTDVAGNAELLEDNVSGFVAKAPTVELVDEALERLWQSWEEGRLQAVGKAAGEKVRQQIPPDPAAVFADDIIALIPRS